MKKFKIRKSLRPQILGLGFLLLCLVGIALAVLLRNNSFDIRNQAAGKKCPTDCYDGYMWKLDRFKVCRPTKKCPRPTPTPKPTPKPKISPTPTPRVTPKPNPTPMPTPPPKPTEYYYPLTPTPRPPQPTSMPVPTQLP